VSTHCERWRWSDGAHSSLGGCFHTTYGCSRRETIPSAWLLAFPYSADLNVQVAWYLGDTTESLNMLATGVVDVALTYNPAAEKQVVDSGASVQRVYAFRVSGILTITSSENST